MSDDDYSNDGEFDDDMEEKKNIEENADPDCPEE